MTETADRPQKRQYYLAIAEQVARRGTCLHRNFGAVIVNDDQIVSSGYTGAPRGARHCAQYGRCLREERGVKRGQQYELCRSVHAEMNAIIHAARRDMVGADLYLVGVTSRGAIEYGRWPCRLCKRLIVNAGIERVTVWGAADSPTQVTVNDWLVNEETQLVGEDIDWY